MSAVTFAVEGIPAPQGSKDYVGHRAGKAVLVESSAGVDAWRVKIGWLARNAMTRQRLRPFPGAVRIRCDFVMHRPARCPLPTPPATKRPDLDKLIRAVWDAVTSVVVLDDSQFVQSSESKRTAEPGEPTGVTITIEELT